MLSVHAEYYADRANCYFHVLYAYAGVAKWKLITQNAQFEFI